MASPEPPLQASQKRPATDTPETSSKSLKVQGPVPRFLILHATGDRPLAHMSPFAVQKGLEGLVGNPKSVQKLRSGDLLVEAKSDQQAEHLLKITTLADWAITVQPHNSLNSSRGVVLSHDIKHLTEEELLKELEGQGVVGLRRIMLRRDGRKLPSRVHIFTFNKPSLPTSIKAGYLSLEVGEYIPNPLRCFRCQHYGHGNLHCRSNDVVCARCAGTGHDNTSCEQAEKCANCEGPHPAYSRQCPKWKMEYEIQRVKVTQKITFPEARRLVQLSGGVGKPTYASVVKPKMVDTGVQTCLAVPPSQSFSSVAKMLLAGSPDTVSKSTQSVTTSTAVAPKPNIRVLEGPSTASPVAPSSNKKGGRKGKGRVSNMRGPSDVLLEKISPSVASPDITMAVSETSDSEVMDTDTAKALARGKSNGSPPTDDDFDLFS